MDTYYDLSSRIVLEGSFNISNLTGLIRVDFYKSLSPPAWS